MIFKFFDTVRPDLNIDLEILTKDTNLYTTLLFQHEGVFEVKPSKFGNKDDQTAIFTQFLSLAKQEQASLVVTPEYSCPWAVINAIIANPANRPSASKLWALGCESITPGELSHLKTNCAGIDVIVHFDETAAAGGGGVLLDPLCYIFNAHIKTDGAPKLVLLIQFKTQHMGVWENDVEQKKYIPGKEIYVLRNGAASINLFTIICSEASAFHVDHAFKSQLEDRWDEGPFIILNIQMNPKPSYSFFKEFRSAIMKAVHKDIITLNWAKGSHFSNGIPIVLYSKSNFLFRSQQMEIDRDNRYLENHQRGLYYTHKMHNDHCYFLNASPGVFLISHNKPTPGPVPPALFRRTGPEMKNNFVWNAATSVFDPVTLVNDEFIDTLNRLACTNKFFHDATISPIDKERLANISLGKIKVKKVGDSWHSIEKLFTFFLEDDDIIKRLTFFHDEGGVLNANNIIENIDLINNVILPDNNCFPDSFAVFRGNCDEIGFFKTAGFDYRFNLVTKDMQQKATICYIGRKDLADAENLLKEMKKIFADYDQSRKRVLVWYKKNATQIVPVCDDTKPSATDDTSDLPGSISRS